MLGIEIRLARPNMNKMCGCAARAPRSSSLPGRWQPTHRAGLVAVLWCYVI